MEKTVIHRSGSYYCARAFLTLVVAITLVYAAMAATLAIVGEFHTRSFITVLIVFSLALAPVISIWAVYLIALRIFKWESRRAVELGDDGMRESKNGAELRFIPWAGVKEIELDATIGAGATLRVKGAFTEIAISNVDLVLTGPARISEIYKAMGQMNNMRRLFAEVMRAAPHAELNMNALARRRMKEYRWAASNHAGDSRNDGTVK